MKTKILCFVTLFFLSTGFLPAQDKKEKRKKEREEKMEELAENRSFAIIADFIYDRYNRSVVAPLNNFIIIDGDEFILQTAHPFTFGQNGLGGYTFQGRITDYEILTDEDDKNVSIVIQVMSPGLGQGSLNVNFSSYTNARASFLGNFGRRITFAGDIKSLEEASTFIGTPFLGL